MICWQHSEEPVAIFDIFKRPKSADPDTVVLTQLKKAGSDLSKIHPVEFFLYFPNEQNAQKAADYIRAQVFQADVKRAAQGDEWLCVAKKLIVPSPEALQEIRRDFSAMARGLGGQYDGWGTPVIK